MTKDKKAAPTLSESVLGWDQFGQGFRFKLPGGYETHGTGLGIFLSFMLGAVLLCYGSL